jgi:hypothetical protein
MEDPQEVVERVDPPFERTRNNQERLDYSGGNGIGNTADGSAAARSALHLHLYILRPLSILNKTQAQANRNLVMYSGRYAPMHGGEGGAE